jgi:hypothetical protein
MFQLSYWIVVLDYLIARLGPKPLFANGIDLAGRPFHPVSYVPDKRIAHILRIG